MLATMDLQVAAGDVDVDVESELAAMEGAYLEHGDPYSDSESVSELCFWLIQYGVSVLRTVFATPHCLGSQHTPNPSHTTTLPPPLPCLQCEFQDVVDREVTDAMQKISWKEGDTFTIPDRCSSLDLNFMNLGDGGATALSAALRTNVGLTYIFLGFAKIGDAGATSLANALEDHLRLEWVHLLENSIGDKGAAALAGMLGPSKRNHLTVLNLQNNQVGDDGATSLANVLHTNTNLQELNLLGNQIGNRAAKFFYIFMQTNTAVVHLNLESNQLDTDEEKSLVESITLLCDENRDHPDAALERSKVQAEMLHPPCYDETSKSLCTGHGKPTAMYASGGGGGGIGGANHGLVNPNNRDEWCGCVCDAPWYGGNQCQTTTPCPQHAEDACNTALGPFVLTKFLEIDPMTLVELG
jgi:hypothetical protein